MAGLRIIGVEAAGFVTAVLVIIISLSMFA
jgi:hypothetical protein